MDVWSSIIMVVNILLLVAGWLLFQQAKSDLTARAAQVPVRSEIKELHRSISALLEQLKVESGQVSTQLDARCVEARDLLGALDRRLEELNPGRSVGRTSRKKSGAESVRKIGVSSSQQPPLGAPEPVDRRKIVISMADGGLGSSDIAQRTGLSVGEVELILNLRDSLV